MVILMILFCLVCPRLYFAKHFLFYSYFLHSTTLFERSYATVFLIFWIFLSQGTQIPVTWKLVFRSGNRHWLAWLKPIRNRTNIKSRAALRGIRRLYICEISCILHNCQSVFLSPDCMDTKTGIFTFLKYHINYDIPDCIFLNYFHLIFQKLS